jgi:hypothetical protein
MGLLTAPDHANKPRLYMLLQRIIDEVSFLNIESKAHVRQFLFPATMVDRVENLYIQRAHIADAGLSHLGVGGSHTAHHPSVKCAARHHQTILKFRKLRRVLGDEMRRGNNPRGRIPAHSAESFARSSARSFGGPYPPPVGVSNTKTSPE